GMITPYVFTSLMLIDCFSLDSFSMLPAKPQMLHGRESELNQILQNLQQESARIAILGPGGIGKTNLARAILHNSEIAAKHEHRFFIATDSATTSIELAALIGSHLGLKPGKNLTKSVVQHFSSGPSCLLVLDNLETPWEPLQSRAGVEEFLSLLTDIQHLALIVTMRGAERPAKVRWTRPFLEPLKPLSDTAARQTFIEIADDWHDSKEITQLLHLTDNMPLAINLIAHLADHEGCSNILARWHSEKTSLLSVGYDKSSNLDTSIAVSLSSPRIASCPGAKDLLRLLSILPDGLSDVELLQSNLPIQDLLRCRTILLSTSLAFCDDKKRLKSLVPIQEHIRHLYPPSRQLFHPLCKYFHLL
ncbi:P-loop containing nucleoside triphosphate hydrolase protein, partial [Mycena epipterygia]